MMERVPADATPLPLASRPPHPLLPALATVLIPFAAFGLSWLIAGRIPFAVPTRAVHLTGAAAEVTAPRG